MDEPCQQSHQCQGLFVGWQGVHRPLEWHISCIYSHKVLVADKSNLASTDPYSNNLKFTIRYLPHCRSFATQNIFAAETQEPRLKRDDYFLDWRCHMSCTTWLVPVGKLRGVQLYSALARQVSKLIRYYGQQFEWNISLVFFDATDVYA